MVLSVTDIRNGSDWLRWRKIFFPPHSSCFEFINTSLLISRNAQKRIENLSAQLSKFFSKIAYQQFEEMVCNKCLTKASFIQNQHLLTLSQEFVWLT